MTKFELVKIPYSSLSHSSRNDRRRVITLYWLGGDILGGKAEAGQRAVYNSGGAGYVARLSK